MRPYLILVPLLAAACTTSPAAPDSSFVSVRDRFETAPTRLFVAAQPVAGTIDARRWTHDGWVDGTTEISVANGELVGAVDASGTLEVSTFALALDPLDIPEVVFGKPAQLTDVRLTLARPVSAPAIWADDDHATATVNLELDLAWSLATDGTQSPLGTQHLPAIPLDVTLGGSGDHVEATLALHADGTLWSWAGLLELTQLELAVTAATVQ
jgi:hypothetical protein